MKLTGTFTFGTLDGRLKRALTEYVSERLQRLHPKAVFNTETIIAPEDLARAGDQLFTAHSAAQIVFLQQQLLDKRCDLLVVCAADLMQPPVEGVIVAAVPDRVSPFDALLNTDGAIADDLPEGSVVGVLSQRSQAQLCSLWPGLKPRLLAGGAAAALRELTHAHSVENLVLPAAVVERMGLQDRVSEIFFPETMLPGPGQGLLALLAREDDAATREAVAPLHSEASFREMQGELALRDRICSDQDCPVGALAQVSGPSIVITGAVGSQDGGSLNRAVLEGPAEEAAELGVRLAEQLLTHTVSLADLLEADFPDGLPEAVGDEDERDLMADDED